MNSPTRAPLEFGYEPIAAELVRRGLPLDYAERAAAELADHHRDLVAELRAAGRDEAATATEAAQRLGAPRTFIQRTVREYQRRYWCGRWPLATFLFGPLVLLSLVWVATFAVFLTLGYLSQAAESAGFGPPAGNGVVSALDAVAMWSVVAWLTIVAPLGVLWFLAKCASRAALGWQWTLVAALVLAVNLGTMQCGYTGRNIPGGEIKNAATGEPLRPDRFVIGTPVWVFFTSFQDVATWFSGRPRKLVDLLLPVAVAALLIGLHHRAKTRTRLALAAGC